MDARARKFRVIRTVAASTERSDDNMYSADRDHDAQSTIDLLKEMNAQTRR